MSSDLQRDIAEIDRVIADGGVWESEREAWQRIRARLTPDRERVARAIDVALNGALLQAEAFGAADAAIRAMGETP